MKSCHGNPKGTEPALTLEKPSFIYFSTKKGLEILKSRFQAFLLFYILRTSKEVTRLKLT